VRRVKVLKASDVRQRWSEVVNEVSLDQTRVVVEKSGVPVAGVVSPQDLEWLQERDRRLAELRAVMEDVREVFQDVPPEQFGREAAQALTDIRTPRNGTPPT
jgi:prevent-host-death family protein